MPLSDTFTHEDMEILNHLRNQQELYIEQGYGMGDWSRMVCPWCSGESDECMKDPSDFNEKVALLTFLHEDDCKLNAAQLLLDRIIKWY
jgi:hypothetical protein